MYEFLCKLFYIMVWSSNPLTVVSVIERPDDTEIFDVSFEENRVFWREEQDGPTYYLKCISKGNIGDFILLGAQGEDGKEYDEREFHFGHKENFILVAVWSILMGLFQEE